MSFLLACSPSQEEEAVELGTTQQKATADLWASKVAKIQQSQLQADVPMQRVQRIGAHNAHVSTTVPGPGYFVRNNQHRGMDVLLPSGVRNLALDGWSDSKIHGTSCSDSSVCFYHEGDVHTVKVEYILDKITEWLDAPENQNEVLVIWIEDNFTLDDRQVFFRKFLPPFGTHRIFSPTDRANFYPSAWPTHRELVRMGKRVIISVKGNSGYTGATVPGFAGAVSDWVFSESDVDSPGWPENNEFSGYPTCSDSTQSTLGLDFTEFSEQRLVDHYELIYYGDWYKELDVSGAIACGFSVTLDQVEADPSRMGQSGYDYYKRSLKPSIWTFDEGEPNNSDGIEHCARIKPSGRWNDTNCSGEAAFACRKTNITCDALYCPSDYWQVTTTVGPWSEGFSRCPAGTSFLPPQNGFENKALAAKVSSPVWVNFTDRYAEGQWGVDRYAKWYQTEPNNQAGTEHCVEFMGAYGWNDDTCTKSKRHACKRVDAACTSGSCPSDLWVVSTTEANWYWPACPTGYVFGAPGNDAENAALVTAVAGQFVWINLTNRFNANHWEPAPFHNWAPTEPNNFNNNEHCAQMTGTGLWYDQLCSGANKHACRKTWERCTASGCPSDFWTLTATSGAWGSKSCPAGYEFGVPRNSVESAALIAKAAGQSTWLNFTDQGREDLWEAWGEDTSWSPPSFTYWASTEPNNYNGNEHCAMVLSSGAWFDQVCNQSARHACRLTTGSCTQSSCPTNLWALSTSSAAWGGTTCPAGYTFSLPRNLAEQQALVTAAQGQVTWINYTDLSREGSWLSAGQ